MRQSITLIFLSLILSVPFSAYALNCGGLNQRPCTEKERIPSCNRGLVENTQTHRCVRRPNKINAINFSPQKNALTRLSRQSRLPVKFRSTVKQIIREVDQTNRLMQNIDKLSENPQKNRDKLRNAVRQLQAKQKKLEMLKALAESEIDEGKDNDIEETRSYITEAKEQLKLNMKVIIEGAEERTRSTRNLSD